MSKNLIHSLVLTVYNAFDEVNLCLQSIENSFNLSTNPHVNLIIIDDMSKKETQELLQDFADKYDNVFLCRHEKNMGYLSSVNEGISYAKGDVVTLLNSDTTIPKDFTDRILACFNSRKKIGVASPILASGNPFSIKMHKGLSPLDVDKMDNLVKHNASEYPTIVFPDGACFSMSRACLNAVGLFDTAYGVGYFEELDYCMRAHKAGFDTVYIDNLYLYHRSHSSFGKVETRKHMARNGKLFSDKWGDEYKKLHKLFPKSEHKKRTYLNFYSYSSYLYGKTMLVLSKFIPMSSFRHKIRAKFQ